MPTPHWTAYVSALLVPAIAVAALLVGALQWYLAREKLKIDLFERRLAVYESACDLISAVVTKRQVTDEDWQRFVRGTKQAEWLFDRRTLNCISPLLNEAITLMNLQFELKLDTPDSERAENLMKQEEVINWVAWHSVTLREHLEPYLILGHGLDRFRWPWKPLNPNLRR